MRHVFKALLWVAASPFLFAVIVIHGDEAATECCDGFCALIDLLVE